MFTDLLAFVRLRFDRVNPLSSLVQRTSRYHKHYQFRRPQHASLAWNPDIRIFVGQLSNDLTRPCHMVHPYLRESSEAWVKMCTSIIVFMRCIPLHGVWRVSIMPGNRDVLI